MSATLHNLTPEPATRWTWTPADRLPSRRQPDPLLAQAQRLWPDSDHNQREWLRAVAVVRRTSRGWLLDKPQQRQP